MSTIKHPPQNLEDSVLNTEQKSYTSIDEFGATEEHQEITEQQIQQRLSSTLPTLPFTVGPYRILEQLGQGKATAIYYGLEESTQKSITFKLLLPHLQANLDYLQAFLDQGNILKRFQAPYFMDVLDFGQSQWGPWMVIDWVAGTPLDQLIAQGVRWSYQGVCTLMYQCIQAVEALHKAHLLHGGISPSNLIYCGDPRRPHQGKIVLIDPQFFLTSQPFISSLPSETQSEISSKEIKVPPSLEEESPLSVEHSHPLSHQLNKRIDPQIKPWITNPVYVCPEILNGHPLSTASDLYSFGVLLFELCTGELPFRKEGDALIEQIFHQSAPPPSKRMMPWPYSATLEALILNLLSKKPTSRCQTVQDVKHLLKQELDRAFNPSSQSFEAEVTQNQTLSIPKDILAFESTHEYLPNDHKRSSLESLPTIQSARIQSKWSRIVSRVNIEGSNSPSWLSHLFWMSVGIGATFLILWLSDSLR